YRLQRGEAADGLTLQTPVGAALPLVRQNPSGPGAYTAQFLDDGRARVVLNEDTRLSGVYRLRTGDGRTVYYVVQPQSEPSRNGASGSQPPPLAPCSAADRAAVRQHLELTETTDGEELLATLRELGQREELWWWFLLVVTALLCAEVWL